MPTHKNCFLVSVFNVSVEWYETCKYSPTQNLSYVNVHSSSSLSGQSNGLWVISENSDNSLSSFAKALRREYSAISYNQNATHFFLKKIELINQCIAYFNLKLRISLGRELNFYFCIVCASKG